MAAETPLEREYPHFEEIYNLVTGKDGRVMTDPTPLEQARSELSAQADYQDSLGNDYMDCVKVAHVRALLAAPTPEPARLSAEALEAAAQIADEWARSTSCSSHEDNPCCHVRTGRAIAARIRALAAPTPEPSIAEGGGLSGHMVVESRSVQRRKAIQRGEPMPTFTPEPARLSAEALPQRGPMELADALDVRAGYLSGQSWELPATQAMMREAATMLRALAAPPQGTDPSQE